MVSHRQSADIYGSHGRDEGDGEAGGRAERGGRKVRCV